MIGMQAEMAQERMKRLEETLTDIAIPEMAGTITIGVSSGFTDFADPSSLEAAINQADRKCIAESRNASSSSTRKWDCSPLRTDAFREPQSKATNEQQKRVQSLVGL